MVSQRISSTAIGAATCRLIEQYQPENTQLFQDSIVKDLVAAPIRVMMQSAGMRNLAIQQMDAITPGIYGAQISRTRFIDDVVLASVAQGIEQIVILGAGLDTRAYRLNALEHLRVFEVDLPFVQEKKKKMLYKHFGRLPEQVTFLPVDFATQDFMTVLAETSFAPERQALFIWEGVTQYLAEDAVQKTLMSIGSSVPGSVLVFTYVLKGCIERHADIPGAGKMMDTMAKRDTPWLFGLEPSRIAAYLSPYHLRLITDVGNTDYQEKYFQPLGRTLVISEIERIAQAVVF